MPTSPTCKKEVLNLRNFSPETMYVRVNEKLAVTAGRLYYGRLADVDFAKIRDLIGEHLLLALYVARNAANKVRPHG